MTQSLYSTRWHQIAPLRPRWRIHARCDRQMVRGEVWYVAVGDGRTQSIRLDALAWMILGRCDGRTSVADIWAAAMAENPECAPTQDQVIELVARLVYERCLDVDGLPSSAVMLAEDKRLLRRERWARWNPLAPRIPLGDPTPFLRALAPLGRWVFGPSGALVWAFLVCGAAWVLVSDGDAVWRHAQAWLDSPRYVFLAWVVWGPMKVVHEVAHGLAIVRWGGHVREAGVGFMLGWPVPYVDASAADRFVFAHQRVLVSTAGIMAELALAAFGLLVWAMVEPGWLRDLGFALAAAGTVSTVLFNANPLVRMDGYHAVCDWAGLPNWASRSSTWWVAATQRVLGWGEASGPRVAPRELGWLVVYAPCAWLWRALMWTGLVWWVGAWQSWLGYGLGVFAFLWLGVRPIMSVLQGPARAGVAWAVRRRVHGRAVLFGLLILVGLCVVPLPDRSMVMAVVQAPEDSVVRAGVDGVVRMARPEGSVHAGTLVLELDDPALQQHVDGLSLQRQGAESEWIGRLRTDPARAAQAQETLRRVDLALVEAERRQAAQRVQAATTGTLVWERSSEWPGVFVREGDILGRILDGRPPLMRAVLDQDEAVRARLTPPRAVAVRLAEGSGDVLSGRLARHVPAAITTLPDPGLGDRLGGTVTVDPQDPEGLRPAYPTYAVDLVVNWSAAPLPRIGGRAWVRFDYGYAPLAHQWWRWLRQTVRARFGATSP